MKGGSSQVREADRGVYETVPSLTTHPTSKERHRAGWRKTLPLAIFAVAIVLSINIAFGVWASLRGGLKDGIGTIYEGSCFSVSHLSLLVHLIINVLSTALLSASNYAMQCLAAPVREDIDKAHQKGDWLDIGVPSFRNLTRINRKRAVLVMALAISSLPLHLVYNSVAFKVIYANDYFVAIVTHDFQSGAPYDENRQNDLSQLPKNDNDTLVDGEYADRVNGIENPAFQTLPSHYPFQQLQAEASDLQRLSRKDCIQAYSNPIQTNRRNLFAVTAKNSYEDGSLVIWTQSFPTKPDDQDFDPLGWVCAFSDSYTDPEQSEKARCNVQDAIHAGNSWTIADNPIDYCLSQVVEDRCEMQFSLVLLMVVILCNIIKGLSMVLALRHLDNRHLITMGDAIASFVDDEDETTHGLCLTSRTHVVPWKSWISHPPWKSHPLWTSLPRSAVYTPKAIALICSVGRARWLLLWCLSITTINGAGFLLQQGIGTVKLSGQSTSLASLAKVGIGAVSSNFLVRVNGNIGAHNSLIGYVLLANLPQLVLSAVHLLYNAHFTIMALSKEWSRFSTTRKTLRVSYPKGAQRSTYFLNLPYRYALPLMFASGTLHWLVSQSLFLVRIRTLDDFGDEDPVHAITTAGYSCIALILAIVLGVVMLIACLLFSCSLSLPKSGPPMGPHCSVVVSAACHPDAAERDSDQPLSMKPLMWGATTRRDSRGVGHCTFASIGLEALVAGRSYS